MMRRTVSVRCSMRNPDKTPVFSVIATPNVLKVNDVCEVMMRAQAFSTRSARTEFCKTHNIEYDMVTEHLEVVQKLERTWPLVCEDRAERPSIQNNIVPLKNFLFNWNRNKNPFDLD